MNNTSERDTAVNPVNSILNKRVTEMTWAEIMSLGTGQRITAADLHQKFRAISEENKNRREAESGH